MVIRCDSLEQFLDVTYGLVTRGLRFDADASTLTISLTGGY